MTDHFSALARLAMAANRDHVADIKAQAHGADIEREFGPRAWLSEFCTVRLGIGRRSGKTTFIRREVTADDVVLVPNRAMAVEYRGTQARLLDADVLMHRGFPLRNEPVGRLFVDDVVVFRNHARLRDEFFEVCSLVKWLAPGPQIVVFGEHY